MVAQVRGAKRYGYFWRGEMNHSIAITALLDVEKSLHLSNYLVTLSQEGPAILDRFRKLLKKKNLRRRIVEEFKAGCDITEISQWECTTLRVIEGVIREWMIEQDLYKQAARKPEQDGV